MHILKFRVNSLFGKYSVRLDFTKKANIPYYSSPLIIFIEEDKHYIRRTEGYSFGNYLLCKIIFNYYLGLCTSLMR